MTRYTVTNRETGESLDFSNQTEALDYAQKVNGQRMARLTEITQPNRRKDLGEMKYEILFDTKKDGGPIGERRSVYRIKALRSFAAIDKPVEAGELGGWVGGPDNLSHQGMCWVYDNAEVFDSAFISDHAAICGKARVGNNAKVRDFAVVKDYASVYGNSEISSFAVIENASYIWSNKIGGCAHIINGTIDTDLDGDVEIDGIGDIKNINYVPASKSPLKKGITFYTGLFYKRFIRCYGKTFEGIEAFKRYVDDTKSLSSEARKNLDWILAKYGNSI